MDEAMYIVKAYNQNDLCIGHSTGNLMDVVFWAEKMLKNDKTVNRISMERTDQK